MRDYDKEPIKIIDRAVYFQNNIVLFLSLGCLYKIFNLEATPLNLKFYTHFSADLVMFIVVVFLLLPATLLWLIKRKGSPAYFLLENNKIKEFVEKQLERALASKEGEDLKTSENFYKYYEKNFLNLEKKERKIVFDIILNLVRYYEGVRKIDKIKEEEGN